VGAQQYARARRIAVLIGVEDDAEGRVRLAAFRKGMHNLGWSEGRDIQMDVRFAAGDADRARAYGAELIGWAPDVILANSSLVVAALKQQTKTIPIVFAQVVDPVNSGLVDSLARPSGNITGFVSLNFGIGAKWLEILKQIAPHVVRVGVLRDPQTPGGSGQLGAIQAATSSFRVELEALDVRDTASIERGLSVFAREPNGGLIILNSVAASIHHKLITDLAACLRLPASTRTAFLWRTAVWFLMELTITTCGGRLRDMLIVFSRERNRLSFRFKSPPNLSWSSTSRPLRRSDLLRRPHCSPAPTR
jgi:putative tryptophan/tyrosine transport system substrate-binding protein